MEAFGYISPSFSTMFVFWIGLLDAVDIESAEGKNQKGNCLTLVMTARIWVLGINNLKVKPFHEACTVY